MRIRKNIKQPEYPIVKVFGLLWDVDVSIVENRLLTFDDPFEGAERRTVEGPYCPNCKRDMKSLKIIDENSSGYKCSGECKIEKRFQISDYSLRQEVLEQHNAKMRSMREIISLDLPPTKIEVEYTEDDNYFLSARITQKDGRKLLVVYAGEKKDKQNKKDYSQFIIDLDQKQIRYDNSNKMPYEFIATLICEIKNTKTVIEFNENKQ